MLATPGMGLTAGGEDNGGNEVMRFKISSSRNLRESVDGARAGNHTEGAGQRGRKWSWARTVLGTVMPLLSPSVGVGQVNAEVEAEHAAAVERIAQVLLSGSREYAFPDDGGAWGLVVGRFEKGDEKAVEFGADVGEFYSIRGFGLAGADVDIRVFDPEGILIREDVLEDNVPVVSFTAESRGTYRAVMSAGTVTGGSSYAGMVVLRPPDLRNDGGNRS